MLKVNCNNLKSNINNLKKIFDDYEIVELNLFNALKNSCISWHDGNSILFNEKINEEKLETKNFLELVKARKNFYENIYNKYSTIGDIIECNLNSYKALISKVDSCITYGNNIINDINSIGYDTSYARGKVSSAVSRLEQVRVDLTSKFDKMIEIENDLGTITKKLGNREVKDFDFAITKVSYSGESVLDMNAIDKDIEDINYYTSEELKIVDVLFDNLIITGDDYNSDTNSIEDDVLNLKAKMKTLNTKRSKYIDILMKTVDNYRNSVSETLKILNGGV